MRGEKSKKEKEGKEKQENARVVHMRRELKSDLSHISCRCVYTEKRQDASRELP